MNCSLQLYVKCGIPIVLQTFFASMYVFMLQQLLPANSSSVIPNGSYPSFFSSSADTELSTPPLIPNNTFLFSIFTSSTVAINLETFIYLFNFY